MQNKIFISSITVIGFWLFHLFLNGREATVDQPLEEKVLLSLIIFTGSYVGQKLSENYRNS